LAEKFSSLDGADDLITEEDITLYFEACREEAYSDGSLVCAALGDIAQTRDMLQIAHV
jgi:DNA-binding phage protein